jgi:glycosyltransferase involved in cell wall biosynthesis
MRVCLISYEFPPGGGGEASYVRGLASGLGRMGHEVFVVTPRGPSEGSPSELFKVIRTRPRRSFVRELEFLSEAERAVSSLAARGRIDLAHVTFDYPTFLVRLRRRGVPCVATVHHLHLVEAMAMLRHESGARKKVGQVLRASALTALEGRLARQCEAVIAVSAFTAWSVRRFLSVPPEAVRVVRNGIDAGEFAAGDKGRFRGSFPQLGDKTVLYVGRLERSKGVHYLIPAFARVLAGVPDATMAIVGRGGGDYSRELVRIARSEGVLDRITFTGRVTQGLLADAYAASAVVALPSLMEGFGITLLEAMASGRPCVGTRVGAVPEIVEDGVNGLLVDPADSEALGGAISAILSDPGRGEAMGRKGLEVVKGKFSLDQMVNGTAEVYRDVLSKWKR